MNTNSAVSEMLFSLTNENSTKSYHSSSSEVENFISEETVQLFQTINSVIISTIISILGTVANAINIIVFLKRGFQETINITLFALTISDLSSLITLLWSSVCNSPYFQHANTFLLANEIGLITGMWPHVMFCRITGWLTALITVERCLSVVFPLKIKMILSPTRIQLIVVAIYILVTASFVPIFYSTKLAWKSAPEINRTMLGVVYTDNRSQLLRFTSLLGGVASVIGFSVIIVVATVILVVSLNAKTKWRQETVTSGKGQSTAIKDNKVVKMVIVIAIIFILCLLPPSMLNVPLALVPGFDYFGKYGNLNRILSSFCVILEGFNSSINIFVYYYMSLNYRTTFKSIFLKIKP